MKNTTKRVITPGKQTNKHITIVIVVSSFSVIVSCIFISLLLVTVGVVYNRVGSSIRLASSILLDGENISFDASLVAVSDNRTSGVRDSRQIRVTALPN